MLQFQEERLYGAAGSLRSLDRLIDQTIEYTRQRQAFGKRLVDQPMMKNVLADLALESIRRDVTDALSADVAGVAIRGTTRTVSDSRSYPAAQHADDDLLIPIRAVDPNRARLRDRRRPMTDQRWWCSQESRHHRW